MNTTFATPTVNTSDIVVNNSILTTEEINAKIESLKAMLPKKEKKETPENVLEKRLFSKEIQHDLFSFGKVQRAANAKLNEGGVEAFKRYLNDKQKITFVDNRLVIAIKSKSILLKITNKGEDIATLSPNRYLNLIISFCTLNQKTFEARKSAK